MINRRRFIGDLACGVSAGILARCPAASADTRSAIEVLLTEPVGTISADLYGYLLENLGTVIYDGVWVGEESKIPNIGGIRKQLIDRMRELKASVIRWPGGNFADYYDWHDGVGPKALRPSRTNFWANVMPKDAANGPQSYDPNQFGTDEFMHLCRLSGGRPYLNVNTRSLSPQDFSRWVEYCNSPSGSTTLAEQRKMNGSAEPYGVGYWGIGNEPWAAGGDLTAEEYATLYKRFTTEIPRYGVDIACVACGGPPGISTEWVSRFLSVCHNALVPVPIYAISIHYYAGLFLNDLAAGRTWQDAVVGDWEKLMVEPLRFGATEWYDLLTKSARMESLIQDHWQAMGELDPKRKIKIAVDEWGGIFKGGTELSAANIRGRAVTLRDALACALTLDIFHGQCDKVALANFTGLINQEGGLFQAEEDQFMTTPIYHVFRMYAAHQGGLSLRTLFDAPSIRYEHKGTAASLWGLNGSASRKGRELTLTVVNPHASEYREASISLRGGKANHAIVTTLTHEKLNARNTFEETDGVSPTTSELKVNGPIFLYNFPPRSVTCLRVNLSDGPP